MLPAQQRLDGDDLAGAQVQFGLIGEHQLTRRQGAAQVGDQRDARRVVFVDLRAVDGVAEVALLGGVHRHVGTAQQRLGVGAVIRAARDADARADFEHEAVELDHRSQRGAESLGDQLGSFAVDEHGELVAAKPRQRVSGAQRPLEARRRFAEARSP